MTMTSTAGIQDAVLTGLLAELDQHLTQNRTLVLQVTPNDHWWAPAAILRVIADSHAPWMSCHQLATYAISTNRLLDYVLDFLLEQCGEPENVNEALARIERGVGKELRAELFLRCLRREVGDGTLSEADWKATYAWRLFCFNVAPLCGSGIRN